MKKPAMVWSLEHDGGDPVHTVVIVPAKLSPKKKVVTAPAYERHKIEWTDCVGARHLVRFDVELPKPMSDAASCTG